MIVAIDPGCKNFCIMVGDNNCFLVDFFTVENLFNTFNKFFQKILNNFKPLDIKLVYIERQLSRNRKAKSIESFLVGYFGGLNIKTKVVCSKLKIEYFNKIFNQTYFKVRSLKACVKKNNYLTPLLYKFISNIKIIIVSSPSFDFQEKKVDQIKKFDDILDTILIYKMNTQEILESAVSRHQVKNPIVVKKIKSIDKDRKLGNGNVKEMFKRQTKLQSKFKSANSLAKTLVSPKSPLDVVKKTKTRLKKAQNTNSNDCSQDIYAIQQEIAGYFKSEDLEQETQENSEQELEQSLPESQDENLPLGVSSSGFGSKLLNDIYNLKCDAQIEKCAQESVMKQLTNKKRKSSPTNNCQDQVIKKTLVKKIKFSDESTSIPTPKSRDLSATSIKNEFDPCMDVLVDDSTCAPSTTEKPPQFHVAVFVVGKKLTFGTIQKSVKNFYDTQIDTFTSKWHSILNITHYYDYVDKSVCYHVYKVENESDLLCWYPIDSCLLKKKMLPLKFIQNLVEKVVPLNDQQVEDTSNINFNSFSLNVNNNYFTLSSDED